MAARCVAVAFLCAIAASLWAADGADDRRPARKSAATESADMTVRPEARAQTVPVPHAGDAADDPAIWIHPSNAELSLILGTDKQGGLCIYNMDGTEQQIVAKESRPNNVDVLSGFRLSGSVVDLAVAGVRQPRKWGIKIWRIDEGTRKLEDVTLDGVIPVFEGTEPYGSCVYRSPRDGRCYFFVNNYHGDVEQYLLQDARNGSVSASRVREFNVGSITEGCVCDDECGFFYIAEERVGIWKYGAEPDAGEKRTQVAKVGEHGLTADVEGLSIYYARGGKGYLIASSQGNHTFKVYRREGNNEFILNINPKAGKIGDVTSTDGIAVTNRPTSAKFPKGLLVVQDGDNGPEHQNFKLYGWEDIAGERLLVDTEWRPK